MLSQARAASGTFADVPADHWAYQAVDTLQKAGIVIGYPDGTYGGRRAMTRYEFAEAIARLLPLLNTDTSNFATKDDLAAAKADLQSKLDSNGAAIDSLKQLVDGFTPELTALGQDVAATKARLDSLEARVAALEAEQARVHITGDLNIIGRATQVSKGDYAIDENGELFEGPFNEESSVRPGLSFHNEEDESGFGGFANNRVFQNDSVLNDFLLGVRGRLNDQATANILLDFGNYIPSLGNTVTPFYAAQGDINPPGGFGPGQTTIWEAYLATPTGYGPLGQGDLRVGRVPVQWTNYTLKSNDADLYTTLYQTDSGNIPLDGASANLHTGPVAWNAWAGTFNAVGYAQPWGGARLSGFTYNESFGYNFVSHQAYSNLAQSFALGLNGYDDAEPFHQGVGLRCTVGGGSSKVGFSLEQFALDTPVQDPETATAVINSTALMTHKMYNRVTVYGVDVNGAVPYFQKSGIGFDGSYNVAAFASGSGFNNIESGFRNSETDDQLSFKCGPVAIKGGYRYIGPDYSAPGYWGNIGSWSNPTNIEGEVVTAKFHVKKTTGVNLGFADYDGAYSTTANGIIYDTPLLHGDEVTQYSAGTGVPLGHRDVVSVGYEYDDYKIKDTQFGVSNGVFNYSGVSWNGQGGHPDQSFLTFGLNHTINTNATFKLTYQYFKYDDNNTGYLSAGDIGGYTNNSEGSTVVGQFSLKF
jgi:polyhydroxyalkanoate synthesis regulator phasin